ncbi:HECT-domain (ubiquitin-transferase) domain-containing protein, partial [Toxoplasma gondii TgCatPRC2]
GLAFVCFDVSVLSVFSRVPFCSGPSERPWSSPVFLPGFRFSYAFHPFGLNSACVPLPNPMCGSSAPGLWMSPDFTPLEFSSPANDPRAEDVTAARGAQLAALDRTFLGRSFDVSGSAANREHRAGEAPPSRATYTPYAYPSLPSRELQEIPANGRERSEAGTAAGEREQARRRELRDAPSEATLGTSRGRRRVAQASEARPRRGGDAGGAGRRRRPLSGSSGSKSRRGSLGRTRETEDSSANATMWGWTFAVSVANRAEVLQHYTNLPAAAFPSPAAGQALRDGFSRLLDSPPSPVADVREDGDKRDGGVGVSNVGRRRTPRRKSHRREAKAFFSLQASLFLDVFQPTVDLSFLRWLLEDVGRHPEVRAEAAKCGRDFSLPKEETEKEHEREEDAEGAATLAGRGPTLERDEFAYGGEEREARTTAAKSRRRQEGQLDSDAEGREERVKASLRCLLESVYHPNILQALVGLAGTCATLEGCGPSFQPAAVFLIKRFAQVICVASSLQLAPWLQGRPLPTRGRPQELTKRSCASSPPPSVHTSLPACVGPSDDPLSSPFFLCSYSSSPSAACTVKHPEDSRDSGGLGAGNGTPASFVLSSPFSGLSSRSEAPRSRVASPASSLYVSSNTEEVSGTSLSTSSLAVSPKAVDDGCSTRAARADLDSAGSSSLAFASMSEERDFQNSAERKEEHLEDEAAARIGRMRFFFLLLFTEIAAQIRVPRVADCVFKSGGETTLSASSLEIADAVSDPSLSSTLPSRPRPLRPSQNIILPPLVEYVGQVLALLFDACKCAYDCACRPQACEARWRAAALQAASRGRAVRSEDLETEREERRHQTIPSRFDATSWPSCCSPFFALEGEASYINSASEPPQMGSAALGSRLVSHSRFQSPDSLERESGRFVFPRCPESCNVPRPLSCPCFLSRQQTSKPNCRSSPQPALPSSSLASSSPSPSPYAVSLVSRQSTRAVCGCSSLPPDLPGVLSEGSVSLPVCGGKCMQSSFCSPHSSCLSDGSFSLSFPPSRVPIHGHDLSVGLPGFCVERAVKDFLLHCRVLQDLRSLEGTFPAAHAIPAAFFVFEFLQRLAALRAVERSRQGDEAVCSNPRLSSLEEDRGRRLEVGDTAGDSWRRGGAETSKAPERTPVRVGAFWNEQLRLDGQRCRGSPGEKGVDRCEIDFWKFLPLLDDACRQMLLPQHLDLRRELFPLVSRLCKTRRQIASELDALPRVETARDGRFSRDTRSGETDSWTRATRILRATEAERRQLAPTQERPDTCNRGQSDGQGRCPFIPSSSSFSPASAVCERERETEADSMVEQEQREYLEGRQGAEGLCRRGVSREEEEFAVDGDSRAELGSVSGQRGSEARTQFSERRNPPHTRSESPRLGRETGATPPSGLFAPPRLLRAEFNVAGRSGETESTRMFQRRQTPPRGSEETYTPLLLTSPLQLSLATHSFQSHKPYKVALSASSFALPLRSEFASPSTGIDAMEALLAPLRLDAGGSRDEIRAFSGKQARESGNAGERKETRETRLPRSCSSRVSPVSQGPDVPVFSPLVVRLHASELQRRLCLRQEAKWQKRSEASALGVVCVSSVSDLSPLLSSYALPEARDPIQAPLSVSEERQGPHVRDSGDAGLEPRGEAAETESRASLIGEGSVELLRDLALCFDADVRTVPLSPYASGAVVGFCSSPEQLAPGDLLTVYAQCRDSVFGSPPNLGSPSPWVPVIEMSNYHTDCLWFAGDYSPSFSPHLFFPAGAPSLSREASHARGDRSTVTRRDRSPDRGQQRGGERHQGSVLERGEERDGERDRGTGFFALGSLAAAVRLGLLDATEAAVFCPDAALSEIGEIQQEEERRDAGKRHGSSFFFKDLHKQRSRPSDSGKAALALAAAAGASALQTKMLDGFPEEEKKLRGDPKQAALLATPQFPFSRPASFLWRLPPSLAVSSCAENAKSKNVTTCLSLDNRDANHDSLTDATVDPHSRDTDSRPASGTEKKPASSQPSLASLPPHTPTSLATSAGRPQQSGHLSRPRSSSCSALSSTLLAVRLPGRASRAPHPPLPPGYQRRNSGFAPLGGPGGPAGLVSRPTRRRTFSGTCVGRGGSASSFVGTLGGSLSSLPTTGRRSSYCASSAPLLSAASLPSHRTLERAPAERQRDSSAGDMGRRSGVFLEHWAPSRDRRDRTTDTREEGERMVGEGIVLQEDSIGRERRFSSSLVREAQDIHADSSASLYSSDSAFSSSATPSLSPFESSAASAVLPGVGDSAGPGMRRTNAARKPPDASQSLGSPQTLETVAGLSRVMPLGSGAFSNSSEAISLTQTEAASVACGAAPSPCFPGEPHSSSVPDISSGQDLCDLSVASSSLARPSPLPSLSSPLPSLPAEAGESQREAAGGMDDEAQGMRGEERVSASEAIHLVSGALIPRDEFLRSGGWRVEFTVGWRQNARNQPLLAPDEGGAPALPRPREASDAEGEESQREEDVRGWHSGPEFGWVPLTHEVSPEEQAVDDLLAKLLEAKETEAGVKVGEQRQADAGLQSAETHEEHRKDRRDRQTPAAVGEPMCAGKSASAKDSESRQATQGRPWSSRSSHALPPSIKIAPPSSRYFWLSCSTQVLSGSGVVSLSPRRGREGPGTSPRPQGESDKTLSLQPQSPRAADAASSVSLLHDAPASSFVSPSSVAAAAAGGEDAGKTLPRLACGSGVPGEGGEGGDGDAQEPCESSRLVLGPSEFLSHPLIPDPPIYQRAFALAEHLKRSYPPESFIPPCYRVLPSPGTLRPSPSAAQRPGASSLSSCPSSLCPSSVSSASASFSALSSESASSSVLSVHPVAARERSVPTFTRLMSRVHARHEQVRQTQVDEVRGVWCVSLQDRQKIYDAVVAGDWGDAHASSLLSHVEGPAGSGHSARSGVSGEGERRESEAPEKPEGRRWGDGDSVEPRHEDDGQFPLPAFASLLERRTPKDFLARAKALCSAPTRHFRRERESCEDSPSLQSPLRASAARRVTQNAGGDSETPEVEVRALPDSVSSSGPTGDSWETHRDQGGVEESGENSSHGGRERDAPSLPLADTLGLPVRAFVGSPGRSPSEGHQETGPVGQGDTAQGGDRAVDDEREAFGEDGKRGRMGSQRQDPARRKSEFQTEGRNELRSVVEKHFLVREKEQFDGKGSYLRTSKVTMELLFSPDVDRIRDLHAALTDLKTAIVEAETLLSSSFSPCSCSPECSSSSSRSSRSLCSARSSFSAEAREAMAARVARLVKRVKMLQQPGARDEVRCSFAVHPADSDSRAKSNEETSSESPSVAWTVGSLKSLLGAGRGVALCPAVKFGPCVTVVQVTRVEHPRPAPRTLCLMNSPAALISNCSSLKICLSRSPYPTHRDWQLLNALPADAFLDAFAPRRVRLVLEGRRGEALTACGESTNSLRRSVPANSVGKAAERRDRTPLKETRQSPPDASRTRALQTASDTEERERREERDEKQREDRGSKAARDAEAAGGHEEENSSGTSPETEEPCVEADGRDTETSRERKGWRRQRRGALDEETSSIVSVTAGVTTDSSRGVTIGQSSEDLQWIEQGEREELGACIELEKAQEKPQSETSLTEAVCDPTPGRRSVVEPQLSSSSVESSSSRGDPSFSISPQIDGIRDAGRQADLERHDRSVFSSERDVSGTQIADRLRCFFAPFPALLCFPRCTSRRQDRSAEGAALEPSRVSPPPPRRVSPDSSSCRLDPPSAEVGDTAQEPAVLPGTVQTGNAVAAEVSTGRTELAEEAADLRSPVVLSERRERLFEEGASTSQAAGFGPCRLPSPATGLCPAVGFDDANAHPGALHASFEEMGDGSSCGGSSWNRILFEQEPGLSYIGPPQPWSRVPDCVTGVAAGGSAFRRVAKRERERVEVPERYDGWRLLVRQVIPEEFQVKAALACEEAVASELSETAAHLANLLSPATANGRGRPHKGPRQGRGSLERATQSREKSRVSIAPQETGGELEMPREGGEGRDRHAVGESANNAGSPSGVVDGEVKGDRQDASIRRGAKNESCVRDRVGRSPIREIDSNGSLVLPVTPESPPSSQAAAVSAASGGASDHPVFPGCLLAGPAQAPDRGVSSPETLPRSPDFCLAASSGAPEVSRPSGREWGVAEEMLASSQLSVSSHSPASQVPRPSASVASASSSPASPETGCLLGLVPVGGVLSPDAVERSFSDQCLRGSDSVRERCQAGETSLSFRSAESLAAPALSPAPLAFSPSVLASVGSGGPHAASRVSGSQWGQLSRVERRPRPRKVFQEALRRALLPMRLEGLLRDLEVRLGVQGEPWPDALLLRLIDITVKANESLRDAKTGPEIRPLTPLLLPLPGSARRREREREQRFRTTGFDLTRTAGEDNHWCLQDENAEKRDSAEQERSIRFEHDEDDRRPFAPSNGSGPDPHTVLLSDSPFSRGSYANPSSLPCSTAEPSPAASHSDACSSQTPDGSSPALPLPPRDFFADLPSSPDTALLDVSPHAFVVRPFQVATSLDGALRVSALDVWTWHLPFFPDLSPDAVAAWLLRAQKVQVCRATQRGKATGDARTRGRQGSEGRSGADAESGEPAGEEAPSSRAGERQLRVFPGGSGGLRGLHGDGFESSEESLHAATSPRFLRHAPSLDSSEDSPHYDFDSDYGVDGGAMTEGGENDGSVFWDDGDAEGERSWPRGREPSFGDPETYDTEEAHTVEGFSNSVNRSWDIDEGFEVPHPREEEGQEHVFVFQDGGMSLASSSESPGASGRAGDGETSSLPGAALPPAPGAPRGASSAGESDDGSSAEEADDLQDAVGEEGEALHPNATASLSRTASGASDVFTRGYVAGVDRLAEELWTLYELLVFRECVKRVKNAERAKREERERRAKRRPTQRAEGLRKTHKQTPCGDSSRRSCAAPASSASASIAAVRSQGARRQRQREPREMERRSTAAEAGEGSERAQVEAREEIEEREQGREGGGRRRSRRQDTGHCHASSSFPYYEGILAVIEEDEASALFDQSKSLRAGCEADGENEEGGSEAISQGERKEDGLSRRGAKPFLTGSSPIYTAVASPLVELPSFCSPLLYQVLYEILLLFLRLGLARCVARGSSSSADLLRYWPPTVGDIRAALQLRLRYLHQVNVSFLFLSPFLPTIPPPHPYTYAERHEVHLGLAASAVSSRGDTAEREEGGATTGARRRGFRLKHPRNSVAFAWLPTGAPAREDLPGAATTEGLRARAAWGLRTLPPVSWRPRKEAARRPRTPGGARTCNRDTDENLSFQKEGRKRSLNQNCVRGTPGSASLAGIPAFSSSLWGRRESEASLEDRDKVLVALAGTKSLLLPAVKNFLFRASTIYRVHAVRQQILRLPGFSYAFREPDRPRQALATVSLSPSFSALLPASHGFCATQPQLASEFPSLSPAGVAQTAPRMSLAWEATVSLVRLHAPLEALCVLSPSRQPRSLLAEGRSGSSATLVVDVAAPLPESWGNVGAAAVLLDRIAARQPETAAASSVSLSQTLPGVRTPGSGGEGAGAEARGLDAGDGRLFAEARFAKSLTGQLARQLQHVETLKLVARERAFVVQLRGEGAQDLGGPYAEILSNLCDDLVSQRLVVECPNARNSVGNNRDVAILNPHVREFLLGADLAAPDSGVHTPQLRGGSPGSDASDSEPFDENTDVWPKRGTGCFESHLRSLEEATELVSLGCQGPSPLGFSDASCASGWAPILPPQPLLPVGPAAARGVRSVEALQAQCVEFCGLFGFFAASPSVATLSAATPTLSTTSRSSSSSAPSSLDAEARETERRRMREAPDHGRRSATCLLSSLGQGLASTLFVVGRLMACAVLTQSPLNLSLSPALWKLLLFQLPSLQDIQAVDVLAAKQLKTFLACAGLTQREGGRLAPAHDKGADAGEEEESEGERGDVEGGEAGEGRETGRVGRLERERDQAILQAFAQNGWTFGDALGRNVELFPGGSQRPVDDAEIAEAVQAALFAKLTEGREAAAWLAYGLYDLLPLPQVQATLTADDLRQLVCGDDDIAISVLMRHSKVTWDTSDARERALIDNLWEVLNAFTKKEKQMFLRFVSGRSRLPRSWVAGDPSASSHKFEIHIMRDEEALEIQDASLRSVRVAEHQTVDDRLPTASTCFFMIKLPKYSSKEVLRQKLKLAITSCVDIDLDALHHDFEFAQFE